MELDFIKEMFDDIAPRYDFLNRLLSLRQDVYWRRVMISALNLPSGNRILDVACGTGDVIIEILHQRKKAKQIIGLDFAPEMLKLARSKLRHYDSQADVSLIAGNGLQLPFEPNSFDAITIAFGIRNIMDRQAALCGFFDRLKPGGSVAVLELNTPKHKLCLSLYLCYFSKLLPIIGSFFSKHMNAYTYLPESVIHFPSPEEFAGIMKQAGFEKIKWRRMTLGIATVHIGRKPL